MKKKCFECFVDSFTFKVIGKEFGQIISLHYQHSLFPVVMMAQVKEIESSENNEHSLLFYLKTDSKFQIDPSQELKRWSLHHFKTFVHAQILTGVDASQSIRNFFHHYDLTEDDISFDSMYRTWQRYFRKKSDEKMSKNLAHYVRQNWTKISIDKLELYIGTFAKSYIESFVLKTSVSRQVLINQVRFYVYYHIGHMKVAEIAKLLKVSEDYIYKNLQRFHNRILRSKELPIPSQSWIDQNISD